VSVFGTLCTLCTFLLLSPLLKGDAYEELSSSELSFAISEVQPLSLSLSLSLSVKLCKALSKQRDKRGPRVKVSSISRNSFRARTWDDEPRLNGHYDGEAAFGSHEKIVVWNAGVQMGDSNGGSVQCRGCDGCARVPKKSWPRHIPRPLPLPLLPTPPPPKVGEMMMADGAPGRSRGPGMGIGTGVRDERSAEVRVAGETDGWWLVDWLQVSRRRDWRVGT